MIYETIKQRFPGRDAARVAWCLASRMTTEAIFLLAGLIFLPAFLRASVGHTGASGYLAFPISCCRSYSVIFWGCFQEFTPAVWAKAKAKE